ncbi:MAG: nitrate reductase [Deltaproteobacteria bacterium]|nr:nitrate reductase [Deltaproteobacteria bacterium]
MEFWQILTYAGAAVALGAIVLRAVRYAGTPIHLRWELYPVAHEKGRADYGGSIFEELDWWTKPRQVDHLNELKEMAEEILFLKGVYLHNRKLWVFSFPFHFGLYLVTAWLALLVVAATGRVAGADPGGGFISACMLAIQVTGYAGLALVLTGSIGLLFRRMSNPDIRRYSAPVEFINLAFFIVTTGVALVVQAMYDPAFKGLTDYMYSTITFNQAVLPDMWMRTEVVLGSLLVAYIPLTRMAHFVAKYFLYHDVRWADEPNPRGGKIEGRIKQAFGYRMDWDAGHIQKNGTWAEVGTEVIDDEGEK